MKAILAAVVSAAALTAFGGWLGASGRIGATAAPTAALVSPPTASPIALRNITLDRAFRVPITITGQNAFAVQAPTTGGFVITEITWVPALTNEAIPCGNNGDGYAPRRQVPVSVNGLTVGVVECGYPAPRTARFDPPIEVRPTDVLALSMAAPGTISSSYSATYTASNVQPMDTAPLIICGYSTLPGET